MNETIELKLKLVKNRSPELLEFAYQEDFFVEQSVYVNGSKFSGNLDLNTLFEDKTKDWFNGEYSDSYLDTCSCGHAGCAGIWNGVRINKKKYAYNYRAKKSDGYDKGILGTGKWSIYISKENLESLRKYIKTFIKANQEILSSGYNELSYIMVEHL